MRQSNWDVVTKHHCLLGEGPVWDTKQKRIFWIDILKGEIQYFYPDSNEHRMCKLGQMLGAIAFKRSGGMIAALKGGFATIDLNNGTMQLISEVETDLPDNRFNDGKCDPAGRFWAGTMSISNTPNAGSLYVLEKDLTVNTKIIGVTCSNGMAWSPDHNTLYYIDTPTRNVVAYNYDVLNGNITNMRVVINIPKGKGYPDGMTIDNEGMLWVALWSGWNVIRYNPYTGKQLHQITLPVSQVTSCVFGGDTMEDLYITSAKVGLSEHELKAQQLAGSLFVIKNSGFKGMNSFEFNG
jgi:sugar lactone lactonase YvrE